MFPLCPMPVEQKNTKDAKAVAAEFQEADGGGICNCE